MKFVDIKKNAYFVIMAFVILSITWLTTFNVNKRISELPESIKDMLYNPYMSIFLVMISSHILLLNLTNNNANSFVFSLIFTALIVGGYYLIFRIQENFVSNESVIYPGCSGATIESLLSLYDGDRLALEKAMYSLGIPVSIKLTEGNAPLIATYFVTKGAKISESCRIG